MGDGERGGGGCWKWIGCSCLAVALVAVLAVVLVVANLERIASSDLVRSARETFEEGKRTVVELQRIEAELASEVDAGGLQLGATIDQRGRRLTVVVVDPVLPEDVDPAVWARQLAVRVGGEVMPLMRLDEIEVSLERRSDGIRSSSRYAFPVETLPELRPSAPGPSSTTPPSRPG